MKQDKQFYADDILNNRSENRDFIIPEELVVPIAKLAFGVIFAVYLIGYHRGKMQAA
jgi:hypothetical protein